MDRSILTLILLILISAGTLYIVVTKKKALEPLTKRCLKGCSPATTITKNCQYFPQPNGKNVYSCPQECHSLNTHRKKNTCARNTDCKYCNKQLLYPNGQPANNAPSPSPTPSSPYTVVPSTPSSHLGAASSKISSLCPASTIVIFNG